MLVDAHGHQREVTGDLRQMIPAFAALRQMPTHRSSVLTREGLHRMERQFLLRDVPHVGHAWIAFLTLISAVLILVLMVPRGSPVCAAISE